MIVVWLQHDCYCEIVTSWLKHDSCFIPCRQKPSIRSIPFPEPRRRKAKNDPTTERGKGSRRAGCTLKPITWTLYPRAHGLIEREKKGKEVGDEKSLEHDGSMDRWTDGLTGQNKQNLLLTFGEVWEILHDRRTVVCFRHSSQREKHGCRNVPAVCEFLWKEIIDDIMIKCIIVNMKGKKKFRVQSSVMEWEISLFTCARRNSTAIP